MTVHAQQLSLLEIDDTPQAEANHAAEQPRRQQTTRRDKPPKTAPPGGESRATIPSKAGSDVAPTLLTTDEAATLLRVHPRTVQRLVERGELPAVHLGSAVRFDPDDLGGLIAGLKNRRAIQPAPAMDRVRAGRGTRVSFSDRLRSTQHEHRTAHA